MATTTRTISIPRQLDPVTVLGPQDQVIREIERAFPELAIVVRGNRIAILSHDTSTESQASQAQDVIETLIQTAFSAPMDADTVRRLLSRSSQRSFHELAQRWVDDPHMRQVYEATAQANHAAQDSDGVGASSQTDASSWDDTSVEFAPSAGSTTESNTADTTAIHDKAEQAGHESMPLTRHGTQLRVPGVITHALGAPVRPKTPGQIAYVNAIATHTITFGIGPAGTGKTYLAVAKAVRAFEDGQVRRIILTRPAVEAGENLGFLPGTLHEKVDPYLRPLFDALADMIGTDRLRKLMADGTIEVAPLAYMRGRTLNDAWVILDEAQNTTAQQMKMFLTRLGFNTRMVITGDATQVDLTVPHSGLADIEQILGGIDDIAFVHLQAQDVVRHKLVGQIVNAYEHMQPAGDGSTHARARRHGARERAEQSSSSASASSSSTNE